MSKQFVIFTDEELKKLLDGGPVRMEASEDLPEIIFYNEYGYSEFQKFWGDED